MSTALLALALALARQESDKVLKAFQDHCERSTEPAQLESCLLDAPDCMGALGPARPGVWYVAGFSGNPHWVCTYEQLPGYMQSH